MINWKVRFLNKHFWIALIPAVTILLQSIFTLLGVDFHLDETAKQLTNIINPLFAVLALMGIVNDPTTEGLSDSSRAMTYLKPN